MLYLSRPLGRKFALRRGMFSDLDGLAVQRIVGFLDVSELARTSCASHDLSTVCAEETEARARARIKLSWYGISGLSNEEACNALLSQRYGRIRSDTVVSDL